MAAPPLIVPSYSASPANAVAAGCVCQQAATTSGTHTDSAGWVYTYQNYKYTAIPASSWRFKQFHISVQLVYTTPSWYPSIDYIITDQSETVTYPDGYSYVNANRKATYDSATGGFVFDTTFPPYYEADGLSFYAEYPGSSSYVYISACSVVAEFERIPHTPTHLLVNSSTAETPAKLVYDPTTNLLVGDY